MRKLMWFTLGFVAACGLFAYGWLESPCTVVITIAAVLALAAAAAGKVCKPLRCVAMAFLGCTVGFVWYLGYHALYLRPAVELDGMEAEASVTISDYSYETDYGSVADGVLEREGKPYQIRLYIQDSTALSPGDAVTGTFRFRLTTEEGREQATYHPGKGIFLLGYQRGEMAVVRLAESQARFFASRLAQHIRDILRKCFPEDVVPFVKALLLGDAYDLDYETDTAFKVTGVRHVVAVSGLHVSILFGMLSLVTFRKRFLTALVGFPVLFLFAAMAGFTPSVTRACIMAALMLLALLCKQEYDGPTALAFAALVMLCANPLVITAVGFQLSVGSVAGIYLFCPGIAAWVKEKLGQEKGRNWRSRLKGWFASSVGVTLSAMTITTPLCAYYFGTVSLIGPVTNLLVLCVISDIFYGIILVCLLSLVTIPGAVILAKVVALPVRYVLAVTKLLSKVPMAAVYTGSLYIVFWLVFVYVLLSAFLMQKNRKPGVLACCACLGLCFALLASWLEPLRDECRMTVLDVGQGQSILLQSEGKTYLVDCGGDNDEKTADLVAQTLLSQGISRLDGMILTHLDRDHAGGALPLLTRIQTDILFLPYTAEPETAALLAQRSGGETVFVQKDLLLTCGDTQMHIFGPIYAGGGNENSLCVLFDTEKCDILITGDRTGFGERMLLRKGIVGDVDVLVAGHHGSGNSTCGQLLDAIRPELVCISVGADNFYGHPAKSTLERLLQYGCRIYRTDQNGTILIRR